MSIEQEPDVTHQSVVAQFTLLEGERLIFIVGMGRSALAARRLLEKDLFERNFDVELAHTLHCWRTWIANCSYHGLYADWVQRSALTLK